MAHDTFTSDVNLNYAAPIPAELSCEVTTPQFSVKDRVLQRYWRHLFSPKNRIPWNLVQIDLIKESISSIYNPNENYYDDEVSDDSDFDEEDNSPTSANYTSHTNLSRSQLIIKLNDQLSPENDVFLLLSMSPGKYPIELYEHQPRLQLRIENHLKDWILSKHMYSYSSKGSVNLHSITEIKHAFFIGAPLLLKSADKFRLFLKFAVCQWIMDDFMRKSVSSGLIPFLPPVFFKDLRKIVTNILSCQYRRMDAVPYFDIPLFHYCLTALYEVIEEIRKAVGFDKYEKHHTFLLQEMMDWIEWQKINAYTFGRSTNVGHERCYFSQRTNFERIRFLRGRGAILEIIQLLYGTPLENSVRNLKVFELFCDAAVVIHTMTMEIFEGESQKISQSVIDEINDAIVDFKRIEGDLRREYGANERVLKFIKNVQCFVDGGIRALVDDWKRGKGGDEGNGRDEKAVVYMLKML